MTDENSSVSHVAVDSVSLPETKTYKRRWYILFVFSLLCVTQGAIWNTWGPLDASMRLVYDWTPRTIALQTSWGPIAYMVSIVFSVWLVDVKGLRVSCLVTAFVIAAGAAFRCVSFKPSLFTYFVHVGQFLNGLGGPLLMPPVVSAVWFPATQRTTATSIGCFSCGFGVALSFIIGPIIVPSPDQNRTFSTNITDTEFVKHRIQILMYAEAAWAVLVLLLIIVYFPAAPKIPPSLTASIPRLNFREGLFGLLRLKRFWLLGWAYGISTGMSAAWSSVIAVNLSRIKVSTVTQDDAAWIGFYAGLAGITAGMVMVCENTYPIAEGVTNGLMTMLDNVMGLVFYLIMMAPIGTAWMNWSVVGCTAACLPVLLFYKDHYSRLDVDTMIVDVTNVSSNTEPLIEDT
ncbi:hypothetical protein CAPTEDRAFT_202014 [Capitella teleta]|uniref:Major facilitator superfamily (MFS) profile domain-containing protein n=1 Tax=Capitella teleta TaxID=283909 RepID=R7T607_CAPTE|nr:hypothetical protein CAPTEDRAFT_202014 [Capitella teleta]|eukprot:ELT88673.1 hypothetical protein CAPTEDRAFT_202014 [Capitella teleta]